MGDQRMSHTCDHHDDGKCDSQRMTPPTEEQTVTIEPRLFVQVGCREHFCPMLCKCTAAVIEEQHATITAQAKQLASWSLALQSLTPGGSEYVDDPERCVRFVRETRESQHAMIAKTVLENKEQAKQIAEKDARADALWRTWKAETGQLTERIATLTAENERMNGVLRSIVDASDHCQCVPGAFDCPLHIALAELIERSQEQSK